MQCLVLLNNKLHMIFEVSIKINNNIITNMHCTHNMSAPIFTQWIQKPEIYQLNSF